MIRTFLAGAAVCFVAALAGLAPAQDGTKGKRKAEGPGTKIVQRKVNGKNFKFSFHDRQKMKRGHPERRFKLASFKGPVTLPIDWAKSLQFPIEGNDTYGDCMAAAAVHGQGTFTGNVGTEWVPSADATVQWYLGLTGGSDSGLDEGTLIQGWKTGAAGDNTQIIVDALDIDPTNATMCQTAIQNFGGVLFMLDVPDAWINSFTGNGGDVWDAPASADQNNGHGTWWNGVDANGRYKLQTWGSWVWITPAGVAACDPSAFVVFAPNWFDPKTGYAPNGLHITQLAALWQQAGGNAIPASVIAAFPPIGPAPAPNPPVPTPPTPVPAGAVTVTLNSDGTYTLNGGTIISGDIGNMTINQLLQASQSKKVVPAVPPKIEPPKKTGRIDDLEKRLDGMDKNMGRLVTVVESTQDAVKALQKTIGPTTMAPGTPHHQGAAVWRNHPQFASKP